VDGDIRVSCAHLDLEPVKARLWLSWSERGLTQAAWAAAGETAEAALGSGYAESTLPEPYRSTLRAYLAGEDVDPVCLPVDPAGTPFQLKVWSALRDIPRGRVRSYAAVAAAVGSPRAMRAVGGANGRNPIAIVVPCHRVVETGNRLGGYTGGLHIKRYLLQLEGARIVAEQVQPGQLELI